ncbi:MAG: hypothetical protein IJ783_02265 [Kiritimatiellae bacterium]|nr:hypothetical protein [Kiritimatiellia bacterium]
MITIKERPEKSIIADSVPGARSTAFVTYAPMSPSASVTLPPRAVTRIRLVNHSLRTVRTFCGTFSVSSGAVATKSSQRAMLSRSTREDGEINELAAAVAAAYGMDSNSVHQLRYRASRRLETELRRLSAPGGDFAAAIRASHP